MRLSETILSNNNNNNGENIFCIINMFFLYDENEYLRRKKKHKEECNFGVYKHVENLHNTFGNIWFINEKKKKQIS